MSAFVVDTNVAVAASDRAPHAGGACVARCKQSIGMAMASVVVVDANGSIFREYRRNLNPDGRPGAGDYFFQWLWANQANPAHCEQVQLTPRGYDDFEEFPQHAELAGFDPADRKFVAVAVACSSHPLVLQALDPKWWGYRQALAQAGVQVCFVCLDPSPEDD